MTLAYNLSLAAEKAFENGFSAGEERGISKGAQQKAVETAKTLLTFGDSIEKVSKVTGLSIEEIEKL